MTINRDGGPAPGADAPDGSQAPAEQSVAPPVVLSKDDPRESRPAEPSEAPAAEPSRDPKGPESKSSKRKVSKRKASKPPAAPKARRRRPSGAVLVLVALLVLSLTASGWFWRQTRSDDKVDAARRTVTAVAQTYAINLTTYDHATLDRDFARVLDNSTGSFKNQYTLASQTLRGLIAKFKAVATGKVLEIAVTSVDTKRAQVLLFVDQTVTNSNAKDPRIDRSRMKMGLEKEGDRWLINSLDLI